MGGLARVAELGRQNIGFALFLAWDYIALYGCAMAIGSFVPYNLEYIWIVSGLGTLVSAAVVLGLVRRGSAGRRRLEITRRWGVAATACAVAGNVALWTSYALIETFWVLFAVAGLLDGIAIALFTAIWGMRLIRCNEARIEFDVVACFTVSFALYALTLPIKLYGVVNLAVACALPPLSAWFAFRERPADPDSRWVSMHRPTVEPRADRPLPEMRELRAGFALMAAEWFLVAFFRVVDAPIGAYGRYDRYFFAFAIGFLVAAALFVVLIRVMRYVNMSMSYRWLLPAIVANVGVLLVGNGSHASLVAAYALVHAGMFGMQMSLWIALLKYLRRTGGRPEVAFVGMAAAQGLGILVGGGSALLVVKNLQGDALEGAVAVALGTAVLLIMMVGFNPGWYFVRTRRVHAPGAAAPGDGGAFAPACEPAGADGGAAGATPGGGAAGDGAAASAAAAANAAGGPDGARAAAVARVGAMECAGSRATPAPDAASSADGLYDALMRRRAEDLRRAFGLTERETEVAELLLCGRSRPYIRDELGISLNTVHAHARSILAKCGVHSQRELIDLPVDAGGQ